MRKISFLLAAMLLLGTAFMNDASRGEASMTHSNNTVIHVSDFNAEPDDGVDDTQAIQQAIEASRAANVHVIAFDPGVYNLKSPSVETAMLHIHQIKNVKLQGAVDQNGKPATIFQANLALANDVTGEDGAGHLLIEQSKNVTIENIILDYFPRFGTAGEIVAVDEATDTVTVDVLPGMPHFDGMRAYSANAWDLTTKDLIEVDALTIGTDKTKFENTWQQVPGYERRYQISGMNFSHLVEVGQGMSWHFNVIGPNPSTRIMESHNIKLNNVSIYNTLEIGILAGYNKNLTFTNVRFEPEGNSLAVGPRDAFHLSNNSGKLLMDGVYVKGVRWDPINSRSRMIEVTEILSENQIRGEYYLLRHVPLKAGDKVVFFSGDRPVEREIASAFSPSDGVYVLTFTENLPEDVQVHDYFSPLALTWQEAIVRNSVFEGNFGTAIVYQGENLLVENTVFRNNAYADIALGPVETTEGPFARNIVIRNNQFLDSTWIPKYNVQHGAVSAYVHHAHYENEKYNDGIVIENNVFQDVKDSIYLTNAQNVLIQNNQFVDVTHQVRIDPNSTQNILSDVPVEETRPLIPQGIVVDQGDAGYSETGNWLDSSLRGFNNSSTRYASDVGATARWKPNITEAGHYKVYVYKVVHSQSDPAQDYVLYHNGQSDAFTVNFREGESGWHELGTFYFSGEGEEYLEVIRDEANGSTRADAALFAKQ